MKSASWVWLVCLAELAACSGGSDGSGADANTPIESTPLSGFIAGQAWTIASADTNAFLSDDSSYFATAYGEPVEACGIAATTQGELLLSVPTALGDYPLGLDMSATFYDPNTNDNLIATQGHLVVDALTSTTISGGAVIEFNDDNHVNGRFSITICP